MIDFVVNVLHYVISFVLIISVIIFIHEFGHYFIARLSGVKATDFSIGFGKVLFSRKDKHGTVWKVCAIPMGGYVKFLGDLDPTSSVLQIDKNQSGDQARMFCNKSLPVKAAIVAAGPIANFIFSIIILTVMLYIQGVNYLPAIINKVQPDSPAQKAGLLSGDHILEINNSDVEDFFQVDRIVSMSPNIPLNFLIERDKQKIAVVVTPKSVDVRSITNNETRIGRIGVQSTVPVYKEINLLESTAYAFRETINICDLTLKAIGQMFTGDRSYREIEGPIGIAKLAGESTKRGIGFTLWLIALLSINLGLVNLLPIPMLDGGHLLFYVIETIAGKRILLHIHKVAIVIGFVIIAGLSVLAVVNDLINIKFF